MKMRCFALVLEESVHGYGVHANARDRTVVEWKRGIGNHVFTGLQHWNEGMF